MRYGVAGILVGGLLAAAVLWPDPQEPQVQPRSASAAALPSRSAEARLDIAPDTQTTPDFHVLGVLVRTTRSTALLKLGDFAQEEYEEGAALGAGWVLDRVRPDGVTVSNGRTSLRLSVTGGAPSPAGAERQTEAASSPPSPSAGGFVQGLPEIAPPAEPPHATNQRFLEAIRARAR